MLTTLGPYDIRDAGITKSSHKNGIYSKMRNATEFGKIWMNKSKVELYTLQVSGVTTAFKCGIEYP